jgi:hypothetical protein
MGSKFVNTIFATNQRFNLSPAWTVGELIINIDHKSQSWHDMITTAVRLFHRQIPGDDEKLRNYVWNFVSFVPFASMRMQTFHPFQLSGVTCHFTLLDKLILKMYRCLFDRNKLQMHSHMSHHQIACDSENSLHSWYHEFRVSVLKNSLESFVETCGWSLPRRVWPFRHSKDDNSGFPILKHIEELTDHPEEFGPFELMLKPVIWTIDLAQPVN